MERNYHIDNIKIVLLFLVAFAHGLMPFRYMGEAFEQVIKFIYLFHMPLFVFCTEYLVRSSSYFVFQLLYIAVGSLMIYFHIINYSTDTLLLSVVEPSSTLYFLVCMIFWRMVCPLLELFEGESQTIYRFSCSWSAFFCIQQMQYDDIANVLFTSILCDRVSCELGSIN